MALFKRFLKFKRGNPKAFEMVKSFRMYQQQYGGVYGTYVEIWEFKSKEDMDKFNEGVMKFKEMQEIDKEFQKMIDHTTMTTSLWNSIT